MGKAEKEVALDPVEAQELRITAQGQGVVSVKDLTPFQGKFKELTEKNAGKLRNQILESGFCSPVVIWKKDGKKFIVDGHERVLVVQQMLDDGVIRLDEVSMERKEGLMLPYSEVFPADEREAKMMLLSFCSSYGTVSKKHVKKFLGGTKLLEEDLQVVFNFPDLLPAVNDDNTEKASKKEGKEVEGKEDKGKRFKAVTCPECGHKFKTPA
jgi:DNA-directed RNA polymerase beta subunit